MKINFQKNPKRQGGLFWLTPFFDVYTYCTLSDEERRIIRETNIYDMVIAKRFPHPYSLKRKSPERVKELIARAPLTVRAVVDYYPEEFTFKDADAADAFIREAHDGFLRFFHILEKNVDPEMHIELEL